VLLVFGYGYTALDPFAPHLRSFAFFAPTPKKLRDRALRIG